MWLRYNYRLLAILVFTSLFVFSLVSKVAPVIVQAGSTASQPASTLQLSIDRQAGDLILGWNPVAGAVQYNIYRGVTPYFSLDVPYIIHANSPYTDTGVANGGNRFYYVVKAVFADNSETLSNQVSQFTFGLNGTAVDISPDLQLTIEADATTAAPGSLLSYTLTYSNMDGDTATGVVITEIVPANATFNAGASTAGWQQVGASNEYTFAVGDVALNESGSITFAVDLVGNWPAGPTSVSNSASISDDGSHGADTNPANNGASVETAVSTGPTNVCGTITSDTTWTALASPYLVTCSVTVNANITLTLQKGTIVKFNNNTSIAVQGSLQSQGTASTPVTFTSIHDDGIGGDINNNGSTTAPAPGDWGTIHVYKDAVLDHTILRYGGRASSSNDNGIIWATGNSSVILRDSEISYAEESGIAVNNNSIATTYTPSLTVERSTISDNGEYGIYMNAISSNGSTNSLSLTDSIVNNNTLDGVRINEAADFIVTGNTINDNGAYSVALYSSEIELSQLHSNSINNNSRNAVLITGSILSGTSVLNAEAPYVLSSITIPSNSLLQILPGAIIKLSNTSIAVQGSLQSQGTASTPVTFTSIHDDGIGGDTNNNGSTTAPAPGDWGTIHVYKDAVLDHTILRYGGRASSSNDNGIIWATGNSSVILRDSEISYAEESGIAVNNNSIATTYTPSLTVERSTISDNGEYGIYMNAISSNGSTNSLSLTDSIVNNNTLDGVRINEATQNTIVRGSSLYDNGDYGLYHANTNPDLVIDARYNWWGSVNGPAPFGSGNGVNFRQCYDNTLQVYYICQYYVNIGPWVGQEYATQSQLGANGPVTNNQTYEGDPVNTATGNYFYTYTDIQIDTRGLLLALARTYNSRDPQISSFGYGWSHTWNIGLVENTDNSVMVTFGDGHAEMWMWNGSAYEGLPGVHATLAKNGDGSFDLNQKDHTNYHFNSNGTLTYVEDQNNNRTTLAYDGQNRLTTVTEPAGRTLFFSYSSPISNMLVSQVTDPIGRSIQYVYDVSSDLVEILDVRGQTTAMTYDANHRLLTTTDANGHTFITNTYDVQGRVANQYDVDGNQWIFAYDEPNHKTIVTSPLGYTTTYVYDGDWRLGQETNALNQIISYAYDADNNRVEIVDRRGNTTTFAYDDSGNLLTATDPLGHVQSFTYDAAHNLLTETDSLNQVTAYSYDANDNLTQITDALNNVTQFSYDGVGQLISLTDANNHTTTYTYDAFGHQTMVTNPLSGTTSWTYDNVGRQLSETDAENRTTTYTYDAANHLLTMTDPLNGVTTYTYDNVGNRVSITDPLNGTTAFTYNAKDLLATTTDPLGNTTTFDYDAVGNQTSITNALGNTVTYSYDALNRRTTVSDPLGNTTTYSYDANGNRTSVTDANSNTTSYVYDARNHLTSVTDAENGTVSYTYDGNGNRLSMTDANNHTTDYTYNVLNRLTSTTDPLNHVVSYGYDGVGNRTTKTKADGGAITYSYDDLDRLTSITFTGGSISYTYDGVGNRLTMQDGLGTTTYTYDDLNRLTQVTNVNGTLAYGYDANGNRTSLTYPNSEVVSYSYDAASRLTTVTDWDNRVTTYSYDAAHRQTQIGYPNGVVAAYTYDNADRLLSLIHTHPTHGTIASATYTLDNVGNRLTMVDLDGTSTYSYDNLYRLTSVTYPDGETVSYSYDPMGNRTSLTSSVHGTTNYTYDAGDRLLTAGATTFAWDDNGNMTSKGSATYTFDPLGRLAQVIDGTQTVQFGYDGDGVRLSKAVDGVATAYVQDLAAPLPIVLAETTATQTSHYIYGNDLLTQLDASGTPTFYHTDGLGSTRALSDATGDQTDSYSYDVFGATRSHTGSAEQEFTFASEQVDTSTSLIFLRARYYDPEIGRFISRDTFPGSDLMSQSWNRYTYVQGNPLLYQDEDGHFWNFVAGAAAGVMEYTVKVAVQNVLEGKPLSQALNGWQPSQAAISGLEGSISYGLGLGPVGSAFVTGVADAAGSALEQHRETGNINMGKVLAEGILGASTDLVIGEAFNMSFGKIRGVNPSGKYARTALFGSHTRRMYLESLANGALSAPLSIGLNTGFDLGGAMIESYNSIYNGASYSYISNQNSYANIPSSTK